MADRAPIVFELFGLEWVRLPFVSYRDWAEWYDDDRSIDGLMAFFDDPPRAAWERQADVSELNEQMIELWLAVRSPPRDAEGNG